MCAPPTTLRFAGPGTAGATDTAPEVVVPHCPPSSWNPPLVSSAVFPLLAFTAFVWLLAHMPATRVASHAYVNPIVAVALGYFLAGEPLTMRTLAGTALVLVSVFLILRRGK